MRRQWRDDLAGLALFVGSVYSGHGMDGVASHGSLAVFVPTASGIVVCTDKRDPEGEFMAKLAGLASFVSELKVERTATVPRATIVSRNRFSSSAIRPVATSPRASQTRERCDIGRSCLGSHGEP